MVKRDTGKEGLSIEGLVFTKDRSKVSMDNYSQYTVVEGFNVSWVGDHIYYVLLVSS